MEIYVPVVGALIFFVVVFSVWYQYVRVVHVVHVVSVCCLSAFFFFVCYRVLCYDVQ